jgi:hypothetical protein
MPPNIHIIKLHITNYDIAGWKEKGLDYRRIDWYLISMHLLMFYHKELLVAEAYSFRGHRLKALATRGDLPVFDGHTK